MCTQRKLKGSGRIVTTIEKKNHFWVKQPGLTILGCTPVAGPFDLDDPRFTEPEEIDDEAQD